MIRKGRLVRLTQKVVGINSENPPGNELALGKFIAKDMRSLGLAVQTFCFAPRRPNIVATLKGTWSRPKAAERSVLITPHFDTVPIGKGWKYDPYGSQIAGKRLYGRGTSDDKGNLACCLEVMRSLVEDGVRLERDIVMAATVDEETGSRFGIIPLLEKKILKPEAAVILDSTQCDAIVAQKGLFHFRVQIFGKKAHGAYPWRGENAIEKAAAVIADMKKYRFKFRKHPLLRPPTMNVGTILGGDKVNVVADFCEFSVDVRFLPGMDSRDILRDIRKVVGAHTKRFKIIVDDIQRPYEIDKNHPLVRTFVSCAQKMRMRAPLKGSEGATVITFFRKHGIPAFATGFGAHGAAHTTDEYADVDVLYKGAQLLERFLKEYDKKWEVGCRT